MRRSNAKIGEAKVEIKFASGLSDQELLPIERKLLLANWEHLLQSATAEVEKSSSKDATSDEIND